MDIVDLFFDIIFAPMRPLVWHPERIAVISGLFFAAYFVLRKRGRVWPVLIAAGVWLLFALYEWNARVQGYNIRVDLFLIYPFLLAFTVWGSLAAWRAYRAKPGS